MKSRKFAIDRLLTRASLELGPAELQNHTMSEMLKLLLVDIAAQGYAKPSEIKAVKNFLVLNPAYDDDDEQPFWIIVSEQDEWAMIRLGLSVTCHG